MGRTFKTVDYQAALDVTVRLGDCLPPKMFSANDEIYRSRWEERWKSISFVKFSESKPGTFRHPFASCSPDGVHLSFQLGPLCAESEYLAIHMLPYNKGGMIRGSCGRISGSRSVGGGYRVPYDAQSGMVMPPWETHCAARPRSRARSLAIDRGCLGRRSSAGRRGTCLRVGTRKRQNSHFLHRVIVTVAGYKNRPVVGSRGRNHRVGGGQGPSAAGVDVAPPRRLVAPRWARSAGRCTQQVSGGPSPDPGGGDPRRPRRVPAFRGWRPQQNDCACVCPQSDRPPQATLPARQYGLVLASACVVPLSRPIRRPINRTMSWCADRGEWG